MTKQHTPDNKNLSPGMNEKTADLLAQKQQEAHKESARREYPVEDKRKDSRREHTNGSTPRRDQ